MPNNLSIPTTGFMRLPTVLAVIPVSKSTWRAEDIRALIEDLQ